MREGLHYRNKPIHTLVHRSPFESSPKDEHGRVEKRRGEGGEKENMLSQHNFNLKQVSTKVKHGHLICLFLWKRKLVTHDVKNFKSTAGESLPLWKCPEAEPKYLSAAAATDGQMEQKMTGRKKDFIPVYLY